MLKEEKSKRKRNKQIRGSRVFGYFWTSNLYNPKLLSEISEGGPWIPVFRKTWQESQKLLLLSKNAIPVRPQGGSFNSLHFTLFCFREVLRSRMIVPEDDVLPQNMSEYKSSMCYKSHMHNIILSLYTFETYIE